VQLAASTGEVFAIPLDMEGSGIGQITGAYGVANLYLAIYNQFVSAASASVDVDASLESGVALARLSMDARIHSGDWKVIARREIPSSVWK